MAEPPVSAGTEAQHRPAVRSQPAVQRDDFEVFYTREMRAVSVFLMHQGATPYEAADAAHEAIAKLLPDQWRTLEHPRAWLRVTAQRCYWRQDDCRTSPTDPVPDRPGGTCPVAEVVLTDTQQRVVGALQQLSPGRRTVMAWLLDGFDYDEIAQMLGMTLVPNQPAAVDGSASCLRIARAVVGRLGARLAEGAPGAGPQRAGHSGTKTGSPRGRSRTGQVRTGSG